MIENILNKYLSEKRKAHSYLVAETARKLASVWHISESLSYEAGLLHDIAKELTLVDFKKWNLKLDENLNAIYADYPQIFHAFVAPLFLKKVYPVRDDILSAIAWHTTGKAALTDLEKIIYIADYIEPDRQFFTKDYITALAYNDLDEAVLAINVASLLFLISKGVKIFPKLIECHNYYLSQISREKVKIITNTVLEIFKNEFKEETK